LESSSASRTVDCQLSWREKGGGGRTDPLDRGRLCVECLGHSSLLSRLVFFVRLRVIVPFRYVSLCFVFVVRDGEQRGMPGLR